MAITPFFLSELFNQTSGLVAAYPCDDITAAGRLASVADYSGGSKTLSALGTGSDRPLGQLNSLNGRPSVLHNGEKPLLYAAGFDFKDLFIMAQYTGGATFDSVYRGLFSGAAVGDGLVADGSGGSSKFFSFGDGSVYTKSQTVYVDSNELAPFSKFEVLRYYNAAGFAWSAGVGFQIAQHKDYDGVLHSGATARRWLGPWTGAFAFSSVQTANAVRAINLYYDLVYQQFRYVNTTLEFPDPTITGIGWTHFNKDPKPWDDVTDKFIYEDDGEDFNERTDTPPQRWQITFTGLSYAQRQIFDTFNDVARRSRTFNLTDKWGVVNTGVRIEEGGYQSSHVDHKSWTNSVSFKLKKA